ncbi:MAG: hypothetical protein K0Q55_3797 [Verrucomicrobia bacterium]|jgi:hypothetical protein|nr:hypothetical protein [Verrucomicrobiota bacterium]
MHPEDGIFADEGVYTLWMPCGMNRNQACWAHLYGHG